MKIQRRLKLTLAGKWYIFLAIMLGATAIFSGNNLLFLLESFILGILILSGVLSDLAVISIKWKRKVRRARVGNRCQDIFTITNTSAIPLFCLEVGEYQLEEKNFISFVFIPYLPGKSSREVTADYIFEKRGNYEWQYEGCSTQFPFGFFHKVSYKLSNGKRIIWPFKKLPQPADHKLEPARKQQGQSTHVDSDLFFKWSTRNYGEDVGYWQRGDDFRRIIWRQYLKSKELILPKGQNTDRELQLFFDAFETENFEQRITDTASYFYLNLSLGGALQLVLNNHLGLHIITDPIQALNQLATTQPVFKGKNR